MLDVEQRRQVRLVTVREEQSVPGDEVDEPAERKLDIGQRSEDVGVVHLEVVDDGDLGQVVDELAAFIEERRVVLVALDDEPFGIREARTLAEVGRDAADQERRIVAGALEDPRKQRSGRGLSMGAGDDQRTLSADETFLEQFR